MTRGPIQQVHGTIINVYVPNNLASKSMTNIDRNIRRIDKQKFIAENCCRYSNVLTSSPLRTKALIPPIAGSVGSR